MLKYGLVTLDADKGAIAVLQSHMSGARALWYYHATKHANSQNLHAMCCKALKQSFEFRHPSLWYPVDLLPKTRRSKRMPFACCHQQTDGSEKGFSIRLPPHRLMSGNTPFEDGTRLLLKVRIYYALITTITRYLISMNRQNVIDPHLVKAHCANFL